MACKDCQTSHQDLQKCHQQSVKIIRIPSVLTLVNFGSRLASVPRAVLIAAPQDIVTSNASHLLLGLRAELLMAHFLLMPVDKSMIVFVHAILLKGRK